MTVKEDLKQLKEKLWSLRGAIYEVATDIEKLDKKLKDGDFGVKIE